MSASKDIFLVAKANITVTDIIVSIAIVFSIFKSKNDLWLGN